MGIYLTAEVPDLSKAESENVPGLGVSMTTTENGFTASELVVSHYNIACDKLDPTKELAPGNFNLPATLRELVDCIYKMGPSAIADNPKYPMHPVPPVPVASALTAIVLTQLPSEEKELHLYGLANDLKTHELDFGGLLGQRVLATLRLIQTLNPAMFQFVTASLELAKTERYPGEQELLKMQGQYVENVSGVIAFQMMQQYELMASEDVAVFKKSPLLGVLSPELAKFDTSRYPAEDLAEMLESLRYVLQSDGFVELYFGSTVTAGEMNANTNLKILLRYIMTGVLFKLMAFDAQMYGKSSKYFGNREKYISNPKFRESLRRL